MLCVFQILGNGSLKMKVWLTFELPWSSEPAHSLTVPKADKHRDSCWSNQVNREKKVQHASSVQLLGPAWQLFSPPADLPNSSPASANHRLAPFPQLTGRQGMGKEWFKTCWLLSRWPCRNHAFTTWWNESALCLLPSVSSSRPGWVDHLPDTFCLITCGPLW